jgi:hypothetical protein
LQDSIEEAERSSFQAALRRNVRRFPLSLFPVLSGGARQSARLTPSIA